MIPIIRKVDYSDIKLKEWFDKKDKMLKANEIMLQAKDDAIKAKDDEIDLLRKRVKEYENIKK